MSTSINKKILAEQLKTKLSSPDYVSMPDLIKYVDGCGDLLAWLNGADSDIHKKENWISGTNINPNPNNRKNSEHLVCYEELEPNDWEEIVSLIKKRNKEKVQTWEEKKRNINDKLNSQSNLYYYWGRTRKNERADCWSEKKGMRGYATFLGRENNRGYHLYIAENHPILDNFSCEPDFYLIGTDKKIERAPSRYWSDGGESNPCNFSKCVELGDYVTLFRYDNGDNKLDSKTIKTLIAYFQKNNFQQITLFSDGNLQVEYNSQTNLVSQKITSEQLLTNSQELQVIKNCLQETYEKSINVERLNSLLTNVSMPINGSNTQNILGWSWLVSGIMLVGIIAMWLIRKKTIRLKKYK